jgi:hypothetical protein
MKISEDFLGPEVNATFTGIAVSEFDDRNSLRPEKQNKGNNPKPNGDAAINGNRRNDIQIKNGYNEKQNEVHTPQDTPQVWRAMNLGSGGRDGGLVLQ